MMHYINAKYPHDQSVCQFLLRTSINRLTDTRHTVCLLAYTNAALLLTVQHQHTNVWPQSCWATVTVLGLHWCLDSVTWDNQGLQLWNSFPAVFPHSQQLRAPGDDA